MKQLNERQLQTHVPWVGWLLIAYSLLQMIGGLIAFAVFMAGSAFWSQFIDNPWVWDPEAVRMFEFFNTFTVVFGVMIGALVIGLAIPALIAGIGLLARKAWARVLGVIVSVFMVLNIPMGTLVGGYAIFVLMQDAAADLFGSRPRGLHPPTLSQVTEI